MTCNVADVLKNLDLLESLANTIHDRGLINNSNHLDFKKELEATKVYLKASKELKEIKTFYESKREKQQRKKTKVSLDVFNFSPTKKYIPFNATQGTDVLSKTISFSGETVLNTVDLQNNPDFELTPKEQAIIDESSKALLDGLRVVPKQGSTNSFNTEYRSNNPALNFISTDAVNPNIAIAIRNAVDTYIVNNLTTLTAPKTNKEIAEMLGLSNKLLEGANEHLIERFAQGGEPAGFAANEIGKTIVQSLGMQVSKNASDEEFTALISGFGNIGLLMMSSLGYIETLAPTTSGFTEEKTTDGQIHFTQDKSKFVKILENGTSVIETGIFVKSNINPKAIEDSNNTTNDILGTKPKRLMPSFEPLDLTEEVKVKRNSYIKPPSEQVNAIVKLKAMEWDFDTSTMDLLEEFFGTDWSNNEELKKAMGMPQTTEDSKTSYEVKRTNEGKARDVKQKLTQLKDFYDAYKDKPQSFHYDWFLGKNLRLHISNLVDPQADKFLTRWVIAPKGMDTELSVDAVKEFLSNHEGNASEEVKNFIFGITQAFDGAPNVADVEKNHLSDVVKSADRLLKMSKEELQTTLNNMINDSNGPKGHVGHAIQAISNILKYQNATEGKFTSNILRETDGKTNGFAHKALQFALGTKEEYEALLKAVGIRNIDEVYTDENGNEQPLTSMAQATASKITSDIYQLLGFNMQKEHISAVNSLPKELINTFIQMLPVKYQLPTTPMSSATQVKGHLRSFVKPAATEVMYAASTKNASEARNKEIADVMMDIYSREFTSDTMQQLSGIMNSLIIVFDRKFRENPKENTPYKRLREEYQSILNAYEGYQGQGWTADNIKDSIGNGLNTNNYNRALYNTVKAISDYLYGKPLKEALDAQFSVYEELNNSINMGMEYVYRVFGKAFSEGRDEVLAKTGTFTSEDQDNLIKKLIHLVPSIGTFGTVDNETKVMLVKKTLGKDYFEGRVEDKDARKTSFVSTPTSYRSGTNIYKLSNGATKGFYMGSLVSSLLRNTFKQPGASTLAIGTQAIDSANLSQTINNTDKVFLPVHDAKVFGPAVTGSSFVFNQSFFEINKDYSMMNAVMKSIAIAKNHADKHGYITNEEDLSLVPNEENPITIEDIVKTLNGYAVEINRNRKEIFENPKLIGQMVDFTGTMFKSEGYSNSEIASIKPIPNKDNVIPSENLNVNNLVKDILDELSNNCE